MAWDGTCMYNPSIHPSEAPPPLTRESKYKMEYYFCTATAAEGSEDRQHSFFSIFYAPKAPPGILVERRRKGTTVTHRAEDIRVGWLVGWREDRAPGESGGSGIDR